MNTRSPYIMSAIGIGVFLALMLFSKSNLDSSGGLLESYANFLKMSALFIIGIIGILLVRYFRANKSHIIWFIVGIVGIIFSAVYIMIGYTLSNIGF